MAIHSIRLRDMNNNNLFLFSLIWGDGHDAFSEECLQKNVCSMIL